MGFFFEKKVILNFEEFSSSVRIVLITGEGLRIFGVLFGGSLHFRISHFVG